ncbi:hypothetical protein CXF86_10475 [Shewanella sp. GutCb]|nr:hypothetical protein CXF86_10475 [Shewanella sp. GutCb]
MGFLSPIIVVIEKEPTDNRIYVKKAVNLTLRNIGKRNTDLNNAAIIVANRIPMFESKSAKWIGRNAQSELVKSDVNILPYPRFLYRKNS